MGIFTELYEAKYKGGKRRGRGLHKGVPFKWKKVITSQRGIIKERQPVDHTIDVLDKVRKEKNGIYVEIAVRFIAQDAKVYVDLNVSGGGSENYESIYGDYIKLDNRKVDEAVRKFKRNLESLLKHIGVMEGNRIVKTHIPFEEAKKLMKGT